MTLAIPLQRIIYGASSRPVDFMGEEAVAAHDGLFRVFGDREGTLFSVVDAEDYLWAIQWCWSPKFSRGGKKVYLRRNTKFMVDGVLVQKTLFLHTAVMERKGDVKPTPEHFMVDHEDGDGMNCRRGNLRWATPSMNRTNRK